MTKSDAQLIKEFLDRGGQITPCPPAQFLQPPPKPQVKLIGKSAVARMRLMRLCQRAEQILRMQGTPLSVRDVAVALKADEGRTRRALLLAVSKGRLCVDRRGRAYLFSMPQVAQ